MIKRDLTQNPVPSDRLFCDLFMQQVQMACVTAAVESGMFDALKTSAKTAGQIADEMKGNPDSVCAVARVLVAYGHLSWSEGKFHLTAESRAYLVRDSNTYRGLQLKGASGYGFWHDKILKTLEAGWSPIGANGKSFSDMWEHGDLSQQAADRFTAMMHTNISGPAIALARSEFFKDVSHVTDVGGGSGVFLAAMRQLYPEKKLTLLELEQVCQSAKSIMNQYIETESIQYFACNMFVDKWVDGSEVFLLSNVLHDWPIDKAKTILNHAIVSLEVGAKIAIFECLLDEDRMGPPHTVAFDLLMYSNHQSQQFSFSQLEALLTETGFHDPRIVFEFGYYSLVIADKKEN